MQPTCCDLHVRSVSDAVLIMHAVAVGVRPMITRRLDVEGRNSIRSGNVYVWEERGPHTDVTGIGIERWTDSIGWGPSKVRDGFLFYTQKTLAHQNHIFRASYADGFDPASNALTKQTYTAFVQTKQGKRKWHLIAYYIQDRLESHLTVDDFPDLMALEVPIENYASARSPKGRPDRITLQRHSRRGSNASLTIPPPPPAFAPYDQSGRTSGSARHPSPPSSPSSQGHSSSQDGGHSQSSLSPTAWSVPPPSSYHPPPQYEDHFRHQQQQSYSHHAHQRQSLHYPQSTSSPMPPSAQGSYNNSLTTCYSRGQAVLATSPMSHSPTSESALPASPSTSPSSNWNSNSRSNSNSAPVPFQSSLLPGPSPVPLPIPQKQDQTRTLRPLVNSDTIDSAFPRRDGTSLEQLEIVDVASARYLNSPPDYASTMQYYHHQHQQQQYGYARHHVPSHGQ